MRRPVDPARRAAPEAPRGDCGGALAAQSARDGLQRPSPSAPASSTIWSSTRRRSPAGPTSASRRRRRWTATPLRARRCSTDGFKRTLRLPAAGGRRRRPRRAGARAAARWRPGATATSPARSSPAPTGCWPTRSASSRSMRGPSPWCRTIWPAGWRSPSASPRAIPPRSAACVERPAGQRLRHAGARQLAAGQRQRSPVLASVGNGRPRGRRRARGAWRLRRHRLRRDARALRMAARRSHRRPPSIAPMRVASACRRAVDAMDARSRRRSPIRRSRRSARIEMRAKRGVGNRARRVCADSRQAWPRLRANACATLPSAAEMQRRPARRGRRGASGRTRHHAARLAADYRRARLIRRRYTVLDLRRRPGLARPRDRRTCLPRDGFWGRQAERGIRDRSDRTQRAVRFKTS